MASLTMTGTPSLRLPGEHFAAGLMFLSAGAAGLIWIAPELAAGLYLSPHVAAVTHCFTLGWLTMTIFGALYQLLPVALGVPIASERAGHASFWSYAPGVALFVCGIAASSAPLRYTGIGLISIGVLCVVINVGISLSRVVARDVIWCAIVVAISFLTLTLILGALLGDNMRAGFLGGWRIRILATHLHIALLGWVLIMIVGISHRLLPMFLLAHTADTRWTRQALTLIPIGVILLTGGLVTTNDALHGALAWVGLVIIEGGIVCFLIQTTIFFRARKRPRLDAGLRHAVIALCFIAIAAGLGPFVLLGGAQNTHFDVAYLMLGLVGGLSLYVIGQFYKVVPFLAWMARFRDDMGRRSVPTVAQLYSPVVANTDLLFLVTGIIGMSAGVIIGATTMVRIAAMCFTIGIALFLSQIARVAFGTSYSLGRTVALIPATRIAQ
jgi:hypothetical protein